ncbi:hypothetical protein [Streptomyces sp. 5-6(2022)]|uniref:hypothetical protein n=1 Tax=Streptomyces sp. 5-6(2022) TaxID=2936510 RepID=UPI0023B97CDE|nr:hypothetical protein [Streptomyces sp. 5-6(2022)]
MTAGAWDLQIEQGSTFAETYTSTNDDGSAVDWTGWTPRAQIRVLAAPDAELLLDLTPYLTITGAAITLSIPAAITTTLTRSGRWDLELVNGATVIRLLQGRAILVPEVTQ